MKPQKRKPGPNFADVRMRYATSEPTQFFIAGVTASDCESVRQLISAAPEMLEALENALAWIDRSHKYGPDMESSRLSCLLDASGILSDAIRKAKGES